MGGITYDGKSISPAPFISYNKTYATSADGTIVGSAFQITLEGKFLPHKGSPTASGTLWLEDTSFPDETVTVDGYMSALLRKQEALRSLFSNEGKTLKINGWDGGQPFTCNPRLKTPIDFPRGGGQTSWANIADYRVVLESDVLYFGNGSIEDGGDVNNYKIESAESNWNLEPENYDLGTYRLTHQITAKGKRFYSSSGTLDKLAWENARDYALNAITLAHDNQFVSATGVLNNEHLGTYNIVRSQSVNELGGTFTATVTALCFAALGNAPATDEFEVNAREDMNGYVTVGLQGKIGGLRLSNLTTDAQASGKYQNAVAKYNSISSSFLARASGYAGYTLHGTPLSTVVGRNPITGVITYNYEYDNRPSTTVSGALSESVQINFQYVSDLFAELPVLGRASGPILQSIQTTTSSKKSIAIEIVMPAKTQTYTPAVPDVNSLISGHIPSATWVFISQNNDSWDANKGRYSRNVTWTYGN